MVEINSLSSKAGSLVRNPDVESTGNFRSADYSQKIGTNDEVHNLKSLSAKQDEIDLWDSVSNQESELDVGTAGEKNDYNRHSVLNVLDHMDKFLDYVMNVDFTVSSPDKAKMATATLNVQKSGFVLNMKGVAMIPCDLKDSDVREKYTKFRGEIIEFINKVKDQEANDSNLDTLKSRLAGMLDNNDNKNTVTVGMIIEAMGFEAAANIEDICLESNNTRANNDEKEDEDIENFVGLNNPSKFRPETSEKKKHRIYELNSTRDNNDETNDEDRECFVGLNNLVASETPEQKYQRIYNWITTDPKKFDSDQEEDQTSLKRPFSSISSENLSDAQASARYYKGTMVDDVV